MVMPRAGGLLEYSRHDQIHVTVSCIWDAELLCELGVWYHVLRRSYARVKPM